MKLSTAVVALVSLVSSVSAVGPMRASAGLMKAARKLEENGDQQEEEEFAFLGDYSLKLLSCKSGETYINPENGEYEYSSVIFRLCPKDTCSNDASEGCSSGYGDFVVGLNSFVQEYLEAKREEMQGDDDFKMEELGECREYEVDQDADDENNQDAYQYFLGPACSDDGTDIKVQMYLDEDCSQVSEEVSFEDISNGVAMPYENGGLVGNYCESCMAYNDNGEYELSEMCMKLYENSGKCESEMESFSQYGMQEDSCEFIESLVPKKSGVGAG